MACAYGRAKGVAAITEAEVIEAEAELKALQRHAIEIVGPEA